MKTNNQLCSSNRFLDPYPTAQDAIPHFCRLFRERKNVYALQQADGSYRPVRAAITTEVIGRHLNGQITVGVYLVTPTVDTCSMAVIDVDQRSKAMAISLVQACAKIGFTTEEILLESSGNKGFHLWLFFEEPLCAKEAMRVGMAVSGHAGLLGKVEVFPKQAHVPEGGFGNLIKLPGRHAKSGRFSRFFSADLNPLDLAILEKIQRLTPTRLSQITLSDHFLPTSREVDCHRGDLARTSGRTPPCIEKMLQGVSAGRRNICAFKLAVFLKERAMPLDLTLGALHAWNQRNDPQLPQWELQAAVRRAYTRDYHGIGCRSADMAAFCAPEACPFMHGSHAEAPPRQTDCSSAVTASC